MTRSARLICDVTGLVLHSLDVDAGVLALSGLPGAGGDYGGDIQRIRDWGPGLVLSLTTGAEMAGAGADTLGTDLRSMSCRWAHLPIPDFAIPPPQESRRWPRISQLIRRSLSAGGRVLVHCRGGCGRSGMIVLRLMIETGEPAEPACARLRRLRPCAIETDAQMGWARGGLASL